MIQPMTVMDDVRLSAVLETPEGAPEGCPLVILLHGLTSAMNRPHTLLAAQAMREAGFATLRFDLYGHGESGGEFHRHTLNKWISNTLAVIDHVRGLGYNDLWLSGHSQGGLVAALAGAMERDRVRGLILRAPAFMIPRGAREGSLLGQDFDPEHIPDVIPVIKGLTLSGNYLREAQAISAEDAADRFRNPVLILQGDEDDLVPAESVKEMAVRYADCDLVILPGETHHFDKHPDEMYRHIRTWLEKHK